VVSKLRLTDLKAHLKDYMELNTKTRTPKGYTESKCSKGQEFHACAYSSK